MEKLSTENSVFLWDGVDHHGKRVQGEMDAQTANIVLSKLLQQGIRSTRIRKKGKPLFSFYRRGVPGAAITMFCRQLSTMISAETPLVQALDIIASGEENEVFREIIRSVQADVSQGAPLSESLAKHGKYFDTLFCSLVAVGEQSGTLDILLNQIATYKEKMDSLKKKIKKAMFYPVTVMVVALMVTASLLLFVVPQLADLFASFGKELPFFTQLVIDLSKFLQYYWWLIFLIIVGGFFLVRYAKKKSPAFRYFLDGLILKIYVIGPIIKKSIFARVSRTLSITIDAGVPLVDSLTSIAGIVENKIYRDAIIQIRDEVATGQQLHASMKNTRLFPNLIVQMIDIGERAGKVEDVLKKLAYFYEEEVDLSVEALSSLIEPLMMLFLGCLIGGFVAAMYLPIFKLGSLF